MNLRKIRGPGKPRAVPRRKGAILGSLVAIGVALVLTVLLILLSAPERGKALVSFFITPWSSPWFLGNTLDYTVLLMTAALGVSFAFKGGTFNLGGDGQIYLGGLVSAVILLSDKTSLGLELLVAAALGSLAVGALMGGLSGFLKRYFAADELITSFLLSASLTPVADYLISGPLRDPSSSLLATERLPETERILRLLPPSTLNASLFFALALAFLLRIFFSRTAVGYRFRVAGASPSFALYGGFPPRTYWVPAMAVSGAIHGLTGFFAVAGTYGVCHRSFSGGLGWSAIAVALIGRNNPLAIIPAALVYGWLKAGSDAAVLSVGLDFDTSAFIQATVLILATVRHFRLRSTP